MTEAIHESHLWHPHLGFPVHAFVPLATRSTLGLFRASWFSFLDITLLGALLVQLTVQSPHLTPASELFAKINSLQCPPLSLPSSGPTVLFVRSPASGQNPVCDPAGLTTDNYQALPGWPHEGKQLSAHQTWRTASALQLSGRTGHWKLSWAAPLGQLCS